MLFLLRKSIEYNSPTSIRQPIGRLKIYAELMGNHKK